MRSFNPEVTCFGLVPPSVEGAWCLESPYKCPKNELYQETCDSLGYHLSDKLGRRGLNYDSMCYVIGDNYGDFTQHLEVIDAKVFTQEFIGEIQEWVKLNPVWRVGTPIQLGKQSAILVHHCSIRYEDETRLSLSEICEQIQGRLEINLRSM